ncbi:hypothetical protein [Actinokineospora fastidiosa]|uniref:Uncharacterized protein n=1 Tax=Actinokineospora fastidiosa TaxID=1816 RepID=A0A918LJJ0_9PSEU|nr:hypothetical protein [Actinokineospora fastidiosa]GGS57348.1 hypothetical protein GCM10010171_60360 [Actinokineospora fastidiosa]
MNRARSVGLVVAVALLTGCRGHPGLDDGPALRPPASPASTVVPPAPTRVVPAAPTRIDGPPGTGPEEIPGVPNPPSRSVPPSCPRYCGDPDAAEPGERPPDEIPGVTVVPTLPAPSDVDATEAP